MRHVASRSLRAALAAAAMLAVAGCVPQPPSTTASGTASPTAAASGSSATPSRTPGTSSAGGTGTKPAATSPAAAPPERLGALQAGPFAAAAPSPVLAGLAAGAPTPTGAGLAARLDGLLGASGLGGRVGYVVADAATGQTLLARRETTPVTPASTTKLLTAVAALSVLGPYTRLTTSVVSAPDGGAVTLVAGGDGLVASGRGDAAAVVGHAGLADLADDTAAALAAAGRTKVALHLDDTVFTGARVSPGWGPADLRSGFVAPVAPLAVESGRAVPGRAARASDPALAATNAFAGLLASRGVTVTGVSRAAAPDGATPLARVESAQVADVVEHMLDESDNTVAEVLARLVAARTDRPATFDGAGEAVVAAVGALRVPTEGARFSGGSGLARGGVIAPRTLTATLVLAASKEHPELRATLTGLPVAGVTGTLADRYAGQDAAVGVVRAKTGTLTGASSLAGTVVDADGRLLVFAVVADRVAATDAARTALDAVASALAGCGCR